MGRSARVPGPAQDSLNRLFAPHLPNVAPPPNQQGLYLPHSAMDAEDEGGLSGASAYASGTSTPGTYGGGLNLEAVGGKIEGWMRKMATRTAAAWEGGQVGPARGQQGNPTGTFVPGGGGTDLIEMNDAFFEIGGDDDDDEQREREASRVQAQRGRQKATGATSGRESGSGVRPRARSGAGAGKGKED